jgi:hypothetical protein
MPFLFLIWKKKCSDVNKYKIGESAKDSNK